MNMKNHSPELSSWPYKGAWSIQAVKRLCPCEDGERRNDRELERSLSRLHRSIWTMLQCCTAAGRFITGVLYAVMQPSRLLYPACQLLIQPFYTLAVTQAVVNTFIHMASERFINHTPSVIFIHVKFNFLPFHKRLSPHVQASGIDMGLPRLLPSLALSTTTLRLQPWVL